MTKPRGSFIGQIPVPLLPAMVGACTLSNVYQSLGFSWIRHITMLAAAVFIAAYTGKIIFCFDTCKKEYGNTVPASLHGGFTMLLMILGSYCFPYHNVIGKGLWFTGLILHAVHILIFTYRNVIRGVHKEVFVPSWFVTYNGIMVSCVVGGIMNERALLTGVVYYGIIIYFILISLMIWRLWKFEMNPQFFHTMAIVLAPCSLCVVSYLNIIEQPNQALLLILYGCVLISLCFVIYQIPKFFSYSFTPGFAGLTFPMAIGIVASSKMSGYLMEMDLELAGNIVKEIQGIQIYITTVIIGFVLYNFGRYMRGIYKETGIRTER